MLQPHSPSRACPTFFKACCREAGAGLFGGYAHPGYHLARHAYDQFNEEEVADELAALLDDALPEEELRRRLLGFLVRELPRCMALVPRRRRETFLEGFLRAVREGEVSR